MRKLIFIFSLIITTLFSNFGYLFSQISEGGTPPSFIYKLKDTTLDRRIIQHYNLNQLMKQDSGRPGPYWTGKSISVGLNMTNSGNWTDLPDGSRIWRLTLSSPGAKAILVCYDNFFIPEGGKLFLYNAIKTQVIGAYTYKNNPVRKLFSTEIIQGESVTLEYFEPLTFKQTQTNSTKINVPSISISEIVHIYKSVPFVEQFSLAKSTQFGSSLPCEVNVNCSEGKNWQTEKRGVAEIYLKFGSSWGWCSGDLINTTNNSGIPYFITADHCHSEGGSTASASDMLQWQFYFNYEATSCSNPSYAPSYNTLTGCILQAASPIDGGSDFCLLLLNNTPPKSYQPYYNGWDRTNIGATNGVGIHHPLADIKKISTFNSTVTSSSWYDGTNIGATDAHWEGTFTTTTNGFGQTEPGSSGSALFNQNKLQVGTLSGGSTADCYNGSFFQYGKFYYHWDKAGNAKSQQLKPWLDPLGLNPSHINGYDPYLAVPPVANFTASPTSSCSGNIKFTDFSSSYPETWEWDFGDGNKSNLQNPTHTYNSSKSFDIKLKVTNKYGTDSITKDSYITINLPEAPTTSDSFICGTGSVNLIAAGSGNLLWYDSPTTGNLINTGYNFATPELNKTTTYYVQSEIIPLPQSVGMTAKTSTGTYYYGTNYNGRWALSFDVLSPIKLISVTVYANSTANRTIWLKNSSGVEIDSLVVNIPTGQQTVNLNFDIPAGTGYLLGTNGQNNLWRDQGMAVFPYTIPDIISITGNNTTSPSNYYYFYNWQIQASSCFSSRTAITAKIIIPLSASINITANPSASVCKNSLVTFTAKATNQGDLPLYNWKVNGQTTGTNSSQFTSSELNDSDIVSCELTSNAICVTNAIVLSNNIIMSVKNVPSTPVPTKIIAGATNIKWNWLTVEEATGYKWNIINDYNTSIDLGLTTNFLQTDLNPNTTYTIYLWAYNNCGNSTTTSISQSTLANPTYKLSGKISYDDIASTPLNKITIILKTKESLHIDSAETEIDGTFSINNLLPGTYITEFKTSNESSGYDPLDALNINRYYIGLFQFDDLIKETAADVNNDQTISPGDALIVNRRYIGSINSFSSGEWLFQNNTINIIDSDLVLNIKALCFGDIDGSKYSIK